MNTSTHGRTPHRTGRPGPLAAREPAGRAAAPVGVLAQLAEARQPQTTKHLQTLERAGIVTSQRTGQRRIYALRAAPLRELAAALSRLADTAEQAGGPRETYDRYGLSLHAERLAAKEPGWADGRSFRFHRSLTGAPGAGLAPPDRGLPARPLVDAR